MPKRTANASVGRPRGFDADEALRRAMDLFWEHGFEKTSLDDVVEATGIPRQSVYRMFGSKQALFARTLELYGKWRHEMLEQLLIQSPSPRKGLLHVLDNWERAALREGSLGCFNLNTMAEFANRCEADIQSAAKQNQAGLEDVITRAFRKAKKLGEIQSKRSPKALAHSMVGVGLASALFGRSGGDPALIRNIIAGGRELLDA